MLFQPRLRSAVFDIAVSIMVLALSLVSTRWPHTTWLAAGMALALLVRRRWPLPVMAVVAALALVQVVLTTKPYIGPLPFDAAVLVAMYSVVKYARRLTDGFLAAAIVVIGIVIEIVRHGTRTWWLQAIFYGAVCGGVWLGGYVTRTRRDHLRGLEERASTLEREREHLAQIAVAQERAAIAREMHDVVAHSLAVIIVQADGGRYAMAADPEKGRETLETVATTARDALDEMRRLIELLRRGAGRDEPEDDRVLWGVSRLGALVARAQAAGLHTTLRAGDLGLADGSSLSVAIYRLVQESLTNVLRHAGPGARCQVEVVREAGRIRVSIVDDGGVTAAGAVGSSADRATGAAGPSADRADGANRVGHGLVGMRERVAVLDGTLTAGPRGRGWEVIALLPERGREDGVDIATASDAPLVAARDGGQP